MRKLIPWWKRSDKYNYGRTWILRDGRWHPEDGSEPGSDERRAPSMGDPVDPRGEWVYRDGITSTDGWVMRDGNWYRDPEYQEEGGDAPGGGERAGDGWVLRDGIWYYEPQNLNEATTTVPQGGGGGERAGDGWVLRDGTWYYEPDHHHQVPHARIPGQTHHDGGKWEYIDGTWHFVTHGHGQGEHDQPRHEGGHMAHMTHRNHDDKMVKVRKVHVPDHGDHSQKLVEKVVNPVTGEVEGGASSNDSPVDYRNWSYSYYEQGGNPEGDGEIFEADLIEASGQAPAERHGSPQYIERGNMAAVIYSDEGEPEPGMAHSSYFIRDGNVGAMVYTEGETEEGHGIPQASTGDGFLPNGPNVLSVDDFKRLHPSPGLLPMQQGVEHLSCDGMNAAEGTGEYWLLRTTPCGENAPEGRILMPNGEILKFYGYPKLVQA
ncbi:hypothetical protein COOONC_05698 [Cooperia oncophora]